MTTNVILITIGRAVLQERNITPPIWIRALGYARQIPPDIPFRPAVSCSLMKMCFIVYGKL